MSAGTSLQQILEGELGLAEERLRPLLLELDHLAQQHADARLRDSAVVGEIAGTGTREVLEHGAQVGEVEQQEPLVVAVLEDEREDARLRLVQAEHLREEERAERGHAGAELRAARAGEAQQLDRARGGRPRVAGLARAAGHAIARLARGAETRDVALHVGDEDRDAGAGELLGEELQGLRLPGAGRAGDQAVAIDHRERQRRERLGMALPSWMIAPNVAARSRGGNAWRAASRTFGSMAAPKPSSRPQSNASARAALLRHAGLCRRRCDPIRLPVTAYSDARTETGRWKRR
jgi:hypothetical protein